MPILFIEAFYDLGQSTFTELNSRWKNNLWRQKMRKIVIAQRIGVQARFEVKVVFHINDEFLHGKSDEPGTYLLLLKYANH